MGIRVVILFASCWLGLATLAAEPWQQALARMPLLTEPTQLTRSNCVDVMLRSFQSNEIVKALIFMPGATDEFYMFRRAQAKISTAHPTLLDAILALTNQTQIALTFRAPFLLLHTAEDSLEPLIEIQHEPTVQKLKRTAFLLYLMANDRDWDSLQPMVREKLKMDIRPWHYSRDSWHFYRHSFVGCGLTSWESLEALCLAGKSRFTVSRNRVTFEPDLRVGATPKL